MERTFLLDLCEKWEVGLGGYAKHIQEIKRAELELLWLAGRSSDAAIGNPLQDCVKRLQ